jgi:hypothetical protein
MLKAGNPMPTLFRDGPYRFHFWAQNCDEPIHVHVEREGMTAKFWVDPVAVARAGHYPAHEIRRIEQIIEKRQAEIIRKWHDFCP